MLQVDADLERIDEAMQSRALIVRMQEYAQYHTMYEPALEFVREKKLMLYGGYALNLIFPEGHKIYDTYELPDLDCFSATPLEHAEELAQRYIDKGYALVEVQRAMKVGAYKLYVDMRPILDLKFIPPAVYARFQQLSKAQQTQIAVHNPTLDLHIAPLDFLRYSIHHEISEPHGEISRWGKVYTRFATFYQFYPFTYDGKCLASMLQQYKQPSMRKMLDALGQRIKEGGLPSIGCSAFILFLREAGHKVPEYSYVDPKIGYYEVLSESANETASDLLATMKALFPEAKFTISRYGEKGKYEHNVPFYTLFLNGKKALVTVHQTVSCHAVVKIGSIKLANIDTTIRFLFHYIFTPVSDAVSEKRKCMINILYNLVQTEENRKKSMFTRFNLDCYGYQASIDTLRRARKDMKRVLFQKQKPL